MITTKEDKGIVNFYWDNGKYLGFAYLEVDGYYVFQFAKGDGFWSEHGLRAIAGKLTEMNKAWNDKVNEYFSNKNDTEYPQ